MNKRDIDKVEITSGDIKAEQLEQLKAIFPEVFTEGEIDFDKLKATLVKATLGKNTDDRPERYSFTWAGKREAIQMLQTPSKATLKPERSESVDFDNTQNLFIEGDNLEVLKLIRKSYSGQVKMIYIDPPYNTGNDFIYPDNYTDPLDNYLELTGQKDSEGNLQTSNPETSGRYHSAWLSMMYPRLFLARQLLRDDGVIFVSIDDHEVHNLRLLMNEVFGEENFLGNIANINNPKGRSDDKFIATAHEYLLVYAKNRNYTCWNGFEPDEKVLVRYNKEDEKGKYREIDLRKTGDEDLKEDRPEMFYYFYYNSDNEDLILTKEKQNLDNYQEIIPIREDGKLGRWRWGFETSREKLINLKCRYMPNRKIWGIFEKDYLEERTLLKPPSAWTYTDVNSERGTEQFTSLGFEKEIFSKPKPIGLIHRALTLATSKNDLVLDFFGGSATTGQAVLELNHEDGNDRRFILVQLPQKTNNPQFPTIADISKERIRRSIQKIKDSENGKLPLQNRETPEDLGFKVLKLSKSNYRQSEELPSDTEPEAYIEQLELFNDPLVDGWKPENVRYEVMLKQGYSLTSRIEEVTEIESATIYKITDEDKRQHFYISLDNQFHFETARTLKLTKNDLLICRDMAIDDTTAANLVLQCRLKTI
ncbi:site-specific DNA-methyltransferase [Anabaena sp. AL09]|uniref:site-specific DNA-methyltransferase n=1 Tax=Anabaena sp. AL09 TaxID=1710891 RepID=UPI0007FBFCF3|nr:site-specific DNA-methyltransferase [Anabaena sp. AL09]OBQ06611.1 MAG: DNA methyltransferase [Anabaena sp. AL09]